MLTELSPGFGSGKSLEAVSISVIVPEDCGTTLIVTLVELPGVKFAVMPITVVLFVDTVQGGLAVAERSFTVTGKTFVKTAFVAVNGPALKMMIV